MSPSPVGTSQTQFQIIYGTNQVLFSEKALDGLEPLINEFWGAYIDF